MTQSGFEIVRLSGCCLGEVVLHKGLKRTNLGTESPVEPSVVLFERYVLEIGKEKKKVYSCCEVCQ